MLATKSPPESNRYVPVNTPLLNGNELKYITQCISSGWISSEGPFVEEFENLFSKKMGRRFGVAVSNGSVALEAALAALGIGPGDEVIVPTFTIISCVAPIVRANAIPVLIDSEPTTWNMSPDHIESRITSRTKAIMVVHIYGLPTDMDPILSIAKKHGLRIIEDAAEMHGQTYSGKPCGSFGDISTFSFYPNKHITTGEGGMILTDDEDIARHLRSLRNLCFQPQRRFFHEELGWNYRMTNIQAALGLAQLERLDEFVLKKKRMGALYTEAFKDLGLVQLPLERTSYAENIYWVYGMVLDDKAGHSAPDLMSKLNSAGVGTRPFFWPMHEQPVFRKRGLFAGETYPIAEKIARNGFYIPSGLGLSNDDLHHVIDSVRSLLGRS